MADDRFPFSRALVFLQRIKYGGAVGKLTAISVAAILMLGIGMICGSGKEYVILPGMVLVVVVVMLGFKAISNTLQRHPELSLLDGSDIVALKKAELSSKGTPYIPLSGIAVHGSGDSLSKIEGPKE